MNEKYGIKRNWDQLTEDAKAEVTEALQRAEQKITFGTIASHWREIVIMGLVIGSIVMWQMWHSTRAELAAKEETFNRLGKIEDIDKSLKEVQTRQDEVYPKIDETIRQIEAARGQINILEKKIKAPVQSQYQAAANKMSLEDLSKDFTSLGYVNQIVK